MLRDALLDAALRRRQVADAPAQRRSPSKQSERPSRAADRDRGRAHDLVWAYCVVAADARLPADLVGVADSQPVRKVAQGNLAVLVSSVPAAEFGAEPLRENLNDLTWLERTARAHELVLERAFEGTTIVPLRMCTIYETEASAAEMLEREREALTNALAALADKQEWGVKLLVDTDRLSEVARARDDEAARLSAELEGRKGGEAYLLGRRVERRVREVADSLAVEVARDVHARIQDWATDAVTRPPQNPELSGHSGRMLLNGAYLVESSRAEGLRELVSELEERHAAIGARIEVTGPWPPYNFVPGETVATLG